MWSGQHDVHAGPVLLVKDPGLLCPPLTTGWFLQLQGLGQQKGEEGHLYPCSFLVPRTETSSVSHWLKWTPRTMFGHKRLGELSI